MMSLRDKGTWQPPFLPSKQPDSLPDGFNRIFFRGILMAWSFSEVNTRLERPVKNR